MANVTLEVLLTCYRQHTGAPETPYYYPSDGRPAAKIGYPFLSHVFRRECRDNGMEQVAAKVLLQRFVSEDGAAEDVRLDTVRGMEQWLRAELARG